MARKGMVICLVLAAAGCQLDWERFDPRSRGGRGGGGGAAAAGGAGSTASAGGTTGEGGRQGGGGSIADGGSTGDGGGMSTTVTVLPAVADCIVIGMEDPDFCAQGVGSLLSVDESNGAFLDLPTHVFLRFDLDPNLVVETVLAAKLRLSTDDGPDAASPSSGEVWEVVPFDRSDLFIAAPATIGNAPIGADLGAVGSGETVEWDLPVPALFDQASVYLGLLPLSGNAVDYYGKDALLPPKLILTLQSSAQ